MQYDNSNYKYIIDIGCGDGSFLLDICKSNQYIEAIGLDISNESVKQGNNLAKSLGLSNRVKFKLHKLGVLPKLPKNEPICFIAAFLLQEILEQEGVQGIEILINLIFDNYPEASLVVIEVANKFSNPELFNDELAKAYYNPYYLIHCLTQQKLETIEFWSELFMKNNLCIKHIVYPNETYDSLQLKTGMLIKKNLNVLK